MHKITFTTTSEGQCSFDEASGLYPAACELQAIVACYFTIDNTVPSATNGLRLSAGDEYSIGKTVSTIRALGQTTSGDLYIVGSDRAAYKGAALIVNGALTDDTLRHTLTSSGVTVTSDGLYGTGRIDYTLGSTLLGNYTIPMGIAAEVSYITSDTSVHTLYRVEDAADNYVALTLGNGTLSFVVCVTSDSTTVTSDYTYTSQLDWGTHHLIECSLFTTSCGLAIDGVFSPRIAIGGYPVFTSDVSQYTTLTSDYLILHQDAVIQGDVWHVADYSLDGGIPNYPASDNCGFANREQ